MTIRDEQRNTESTSEALDHLIDRACDRWRRESTVNVRGFVMMSLADGAPRRVATMRWRLVCGSAAIGVLLLAVVAGLWPPASRPRSPLPDAAAPALLGRPAATTIIPPAPHGASAASGSARVVTQTVRTSGVPLTDAIPSRRSATADAEGWVLGSADRLPDPAPIVVEPITIAPIAAALITETPISVRPIAMPPLDLPSTGHDERQPEGARK